VLHSPIFYLLDTSASALNPSLICKDLCYQRNLHDFGQPVRSLLLPLSDTLRTFIWKRYHLDGNVMPSHLAIFKLVFFPVHIQECPANLPVGVATPSVFPDIRRGCEPSWSFCHCACVRWAIFLQAGRLEQISYSLLCPRAQILKLWTN
jgi:hypothetical protein